MAESKTITNIEAIEKLTENFLKFVAQFKKLESFASQFKLLETMPSQGKILFVKKYLIDYESDLSGFVRFQVLEKNGLKEKDFKEEDITKLTRFLKAFIECSK